MRPTRWQVAALVTLVVVTITVLGWQYIAAQELQARIAQLRTQALERTRLEAENRRLIAAQPTAGDLADLLAKRMMLEQLQARLAAMHRREEESARAGAAPSPTILSLKGTSVGFKLWQNAGQATPDAAFQTALWAAAAGDLDALAGVLALDDEAKNQAAATFDRLPAAMQNELGTPERMIALLTAMDVPMGRASILGQAPTSSDTKISAQLTDAEENVKTATFSLKSVDDQWRLVVPAAVVKKYDSWLRAPAPAGKP